MPIISIWVPRALGVAILAALAWAGSFALRVEALRDGLVTHGTLELTQAMMWLAGAVTVTALLVAALGLLKAKAI